MVCIQRFLSLIIRLYAKYNRKGAVLSPNGHYKVGGRAGILCLYMRGARGAADQQPETETPCFPSSSASSS